MDADRQLPVVHRPQVLEDELGQGPRVAEDERGVVLLDQLHHLLGGIAARVPRPGHAALGNEDREVGLGAGIALDQPHRVDIAVGSEPAAIGVGVADRGAEPNAAEPGGKRLQAGEREAEQIAALLVQAVQITLPLITLAVACLMVSRIRYVHIFNQVFSGRRSRRHLIQIVFGAAVVFLLKELAVPVLLCYFAFASPLRAAWDARQRLGKRDIAGHTG